jgi:hypothetical protein
MPVADASAAGREADGAAPPPRSVESRPYRYRFGIAYLILAVIAGTALGSAYLLYEREPTREAIWSTWQPTGRESTYPAQIAETIGERYRSESGNQLVGVIASTPQIQTGETALPIRFAAFRFEAAVAGEGGQDDFEIVPVSEGSLMYTLCGLGEQCAIAEGEPSPARHQLLQRQALELALYSFKYVEGIDSVLVLLPPNLGDPTNPEDDRQTAMFFRKGDFKRELSAPLRRTLLDRRDQLTVPVADNEQLTLDRLTDERVFLYQFQPTQDGSAAIVLSPVPAGP